MIAWADFKKMQETNSSIQQMINDSHQTAVKENRHYIKAVAEIILFTGQQAIALRGHRENDESRNRGNFFSLLQLIGNHDSIVAKKCAELPRNAKYTAPKIQNEVLNLLADMIRKQIIKEVKSSKYFALIVDESKDVSKSEQVSFVLRYYLKGQVYESFLQFEAAKKLDAKSLTNKILSCLESFGLDYKENLVAQCYDGASVMSGRLSGVSTRIQEVCDNAIYVHCYAHRLNLVLVDIAKSIPKAADFFSLLQRLYVFLSGSYVHNKWKTVQNTMYPKQQPYELHRLSDTRWACRYLACRTICKCFSAILKVLDEIIEETNSDRAIDARGLRAQLDFNFLAMLSLFNIILGKTYPTSNSLQGINIDLEKAADLIESLKDDFREYREEQHFNYLWQDIKELAETCSIDISEEIEEVSAKRRANLPHSLEDSMLTSTRVQHRSKNTKEVFKINVFYPILDRINSELQRRFSNATCDILRGIQCLNPNNENFLSMNNLKSFAEKFNINCEDLYHELHQAKRLIQRKIEEGKCAPTSVLNFTCEIEPYKDAFHELYRLCKIAVTIPVTSASSERSFSALNRIKSYLRNAMTDERLSNLGIINIERKRSKELDLEEFVDIFANNHNNRRIILI